MRMEITGCRARQQPDSVASWAIQFSRWLLDRKTRTRESRFSASVCVCLCAIHPIMLVVLHTGECAPVLPLHSWESEENLNSPSTPFKPALKDLHLSFILIRRWSLGLHPGSHFLHYKVQTKIISRQFPVCLFALSACRLMKPWFGYKVTRPSSRVTFYTSWLLSTGKKINLTFWFLTHPVPQRVTLMDTAPAYRAAAWVRPDCRAQGCLCMLSVGVCAIPAAPQPLLSHAASCCLIPALLMLSLWHMCEPLHLVTVQRPVEAQRGTSLSMHYVYHFPSLSYCGLKHSVLISFSTNPIVHILFFIFNMKKKNCLRLQCTNSTLGYCLLRIVLSIL